MITYKEFALGKISVFLEGKKIGSIFKLKDGYQYWPQDRKKYAGSFWPTLQQVKNDIEG